MKPRRVSIQYRRLPDRVRVFDQAVVHEADTYVVTLLEKAPLPEPVTVGGRTVLEPGAPVVWFTYRGLWYDIGRFHLRDGTFTGIYANILTPVEMDGDRWDTTDLLLDVWAGADGRIELLDEAEFVAAVDAGWLDAATAAAAREHAETLMLGARQGTWPPPHVSEWTLERARREVSPREAPPPTDSGS